MGPAAEAVDRRSPAYVRWYQDALNGVDGAGLVVDGVKGPLTRAAIRRFQTRAGLVVDGIVGPRTEAALMAPPPGFTAPAPPVAVPPGLGLPPGPGLPPAGGVGALESRYFPPAGSKDAAPFGRSSEVVPLVDGAAYFAAVKAEVDRLAAGDVWWVTGWLCSPDFRFGPGGPTLGSLLAIKAAAGVDVHVVLWASRTLLDHPSLGGAVARPFLTVTRINVRAAETLRAAAVTGGAMPLAGRVLLDWSGNAASSHHMKLNVLSRDGVVTAFAGGLDYWPDRWDAPPHATRFTRPDGSTYTWGWHDAGVRVTGDAARAVLDTVATRWTEASTLSPATYDLGAGARPYNPPPLVPLVPPPPRPGPAPSLDTSVQVVRSFPDSKEFRLLGRNVRWTTLPADGVHEVQSTLRTAIAAARRYYT